VWSGNEQTYTASIVVLLFMVVGLSLQQINGFSVCYGRKMKREYRYAIHLPVRSCPRNCSPLNVTAKCHCVRKRDGKAPITMESQETWRCLYLDGRVFG